MSDLEDGEIEPSDYHPAKTRKLDSHSSDRQQPSDTDEQGWTRVGGKRKQKASTPSQKASSKGYYDVYDGETPDVDFKTERCGLYDVQELLLWLLGEGGCPRWVFVKNKVLVKQVVVLMVPGLSKQLYNDNKADMPRLSQLCSKPVTMMALNSTIKPWDTAAAMLTVPWTRKRKRDIKHGDANKPPSANAQPPQPPQHYVLTAQQLRENNYPMPVPVENGSPSEFCCPDGFVATRSACNGGPSKRYGRFNMLALDCEMCITTAGFELTRISLVDEAGDVLMDRFVVPDNPITDYNTRFSGITEETLAGCTTRLKDVQDEFLQLVSAETLLVGHSLDNDLNSLKIVHANVIDTAVMFPHPRGPPYKSALRVLATKFLKRAIQQSSHDSIADAKAAMDLALLKIWKGPKFGEHERTGEGLPLVLSRNKRRCCLVDRGAVVAGFCSGNCSGVPVEGNDSAVLAKLQPQLQQGSNELIWAQFHDLYMHFEQRARMQRKLRSHILNSARPPATPSTQLSPNAETPSITETPTCDTTFDATPATEAHSTLANGATSSLQASKESAERGTERRIVWRDVSRIETPAAFDSSNHSNASQHGAAVENGREQCGMDVRQLFYGEQDARTVELLRQLDSVIGSVCDGLRKHTLLLVVTGHGDTARCRYVQEIKHRSQQKLDDLPPWSLAAEEDYRAVVDCTMQGTCFAAVCKA